MTRIHMTLLLITAIMHPATWASDQCPVDKIMSDEFRTFEYVATADASGRWLAAGTEAVSAGVDNLRVFFFEADEDGRYQLVHFIESPQGDAEDAFGRELVLWADGGGDALAVVGAMFADGVETDHGAAHVYAFNGQEFALQQTLLPFDTHEPEFGSENGDRFGDCVATNGQRIVVGSPYDELDPEDIPTGDDGLRAGSAYVFKYDGTSWQPEQKLRASNQGSFDWFGSAVAIGSGICEGQILVGAFEGTIVGGSTGGVYAFTYNDATSQWIETPGVLLGDAASGLFFGYSMDLHASEDECIAVVGALGQDDDFVSRGGAYVFRFDPSTKTWNEEQKLVPAESDSLRNFGLFVSTSGDRVAIFAAIDDEDGTSFIYDRMVYLFEYDAQQSPPWTEKRKFTTPGTRRVNGFAARGAELYEDKMFVPARTDSTVNISAGAIFEYDLDTAYLLSNGPFQPFAERAFNLYIDPRMESTDRAGLDIGITQFNLTFSEPVHDVGGMDLTAAAFTIENTGSASPPNVLSVETTDRQNVTITIDRPITVDQWTSVRANVAGAAGTSACALHVGFLPGDVNQDGVVAPTDLFRIRQTVNLSLSPIDGAFTDYVDIDRDSNITPLDLFRFRQLINGIGPATRAWGKQSLPFGPTE